MWAGMKFYLVTRIDFSVFFFLIFFFFSLLEPRYCTRLTRVLERSLHQKLRKRGLLFTELSQTR